LTGNSPQPAVLRGFSLGEHIKSPLSVAFGYLLCYNFGIIKNEPHVEGYMTGRERLRRALMGESLDRPPVDFWAEEVTKERLFAYLGHRDLDRFFDDTQIDIREAGAIAPPETHLGNGVFQNHWGERYIYRQLPYGKMREDMPGALCGADSLEEIKAFPWPDNDDFTYTHLGERCQEIREKGCAVRYGFADIWQRPVLVRGMENAMADMLVNPEWIKWMSRRFTDFYLEDFRRAWEASGGRIDLFMVISDLGPQRGPLISLNMFREFIFPYLKEMADLAHNFGVCLLFHSCGDISSFIPDIIRAGVDVLNPLQPVNASMYPESLVKHKGHICFHGGMDVQRLLPVATAAEIHTQARRYFHALGPGYILAPTHLFQPDIPPENILAVYEAFS
jgi:uroporphyrinogen decarboxylase